MRYINLRLTYLLTYLLIARPPCDVLVTWCLRIVYEQRLTECRIKGKQEDLQCEALQHTRPRNENIAVCI